MVVAAQAAPVPPWCWGFLFPHREEPRYVTHMLDRIGNPIWNKDTVAYVRRGNGHQGLHKLLLGTVEVLKDQRWESMYCRVTDLADGSQCLRTGPEIVVCREPPHRVPGPWVGAEVD